MKRLQLWICSSADVGLRHSLNAVCPQTLRQAGLKIFRLADEELGFFLFFSRRSSELYHVSLLARSVFSPSMTLCCVGICINDA